MKRIDYIHHLRAMLNYDFFHIVLTWDERIMIQGEIKRNMGDELVVKAMSGNILNLSAQVLKENWEAIEVKYVEESETLRKVPYYWCSEAEKFKELTREELEKIRNKNK